MAVFFLVSLLASTVGAICGIGGGVIIKPVLDLFHLVYGAVHELLHSGTGDVGGRAAGICGYRYAAGAGGSGGRFAGQPPVLPGEGDERKP